MRKITDCKALDSHRVWLRYDDGVEGAVDLSDLVGKPAFRLWDDYEAFRRVYVSAWNSLAWSDDIELCPDALYLEITRLTPEQLFPKLRQRAAHA